MLTTWQRLLYLHNILIILYQISRTHCFLSNQHETTRNVFIIIGVIVLWVHYTVPTSRYVYEPRQTISSANKLNNNSSWSISAYSDGGGNPSSLSSLIVMTPSSSAQASPSDIEFMPLIIITTIAGNLYRFRHDNYDVWYFPARGAVHAQSTLIQSVWCTSDIWNYHIARYCSCWCGVQEIGERAIIATTLCLQLSGACVHISIWFVWDYGCADVCFYGGWGDIRYSVMRMRRCYIVAWL